MATYPAKGMQRILAGSIDPVLRVTLLDQDGEPAAAIGTLTCTITRADGTVVATDRATTTGTGAGVYTCALTTAEALTLDVLTASWQISDVERAVSYHRTVGSFLFSVSELSQRKGMQSYDVAAKQIARDSITDLIEENTGVAWCPQYDFEERTAPGRCHIITRRPLRSLRSMALDGVTQTTSTMYLDHAAGIIDARFTVCGWMTLGVEHGFSAPSADLKRAALMAAADMLNREGNAIGDRTRSMTNDAGVTQQFSYAGPGHPTGLDEVDAIILAHDLRDPALA